MWLADRPSDRPPGTAQPSAATPPATSASPPLPDHSEEVLTAALRATIATGADDVPILREALRAYVLGLRAHGEPPERALIAVKDRVYDAIRRRPTVPRADASALVQRIVHWAIEAYYRAD